MAVVEGELWWGRRPPATEGSVHARLRKIIPFALTQPRDDDEVSQS